MAKRKTKKRPKQAPKKPPQKIEKGFKPIQHFKKQLGTYLAVISFAITILMLWNYFNDKKIGSSSGVIMSEGLAQIKYIAVGSAVRIKVDTPQGILFKDGGQPLISMSLENRKLSISTTIRDSDGQIQAVLVNNEWQVNKDNIFDRNYNDRAIEVKDKSGNIVLQIAHFGDTIYFAGIFNCKNGRKVFLHPIEKGAAVIELVPPGMDLKHQIVPIFKYPSDRYFGNCPGLKRLERELLHSDFTEYKFKTSMDICTNTND